MARIGSGFFTVLGAAFAVAGADKIIGNRGYARMFGHLGWSRGGLRAVALAEMAGGALLAAGSTRRLGGAIAAATSATVLASEVRRGDTELAVPRALLMGAALTTAGTCRTWRPCRRACPWQASVPAARRTRG